MKIKNLYSLAIIATVSFSASTISASNKSNTTNSEDKIVISGIVTDRTGKAVKGAAIELLNGNDYILTDKQGYYKIEVEPNTKLLVSYLGYNSDTITAVKTEQKNIQLHTNEDLNKIKKSKTNKGNWFGGVGIGASTTF